MRRGLESTPGAKWTGNEGTPSPPFISRGPTSLDLVFNKLVKTGDNRREYKSSLGKNREAHGIGQWKRQQTPDKNMSALPGCPQPNVGGGEDPGLPDFS